MVYRRNAVPLRLTYPQLIKSHAQNLITYYHLLSNTASDKRSQPKNMFSQSTYGAVPVTARRAKRENGGLGEDPPGSPMTYCTGPSDLDAQPSDILHKLQTTNYLTKITPVQRQRHPSETPAPKIETPSIDPPTHMRLTYSLLHVPSNLSLRLV